MLDISYSSISLAIGSCLALAFISSFFKIKLSKIIIVSTLRALCQLLILGHALKYLFNYQSPWLSLLVVSLMSLGATFTIWQRLDQKRGFIFTSLLPILALTVWPLSLVLIFNVNHKMSFEPKLLLPLVGILLGNSLTGITLGLNQVEREIESKKDILITYLGMGASWYQAGQEIFTTAIKSSITPITNSMMVVGLVSFPGVMTGQILAGSPPLISAKYQFMILCFIFLTTFISSFLSCFFSIRYFFKRDLLFI